MSPNSSAYNGAGATSLSSSKRMTPNYASVTQTQFQGNANVREFTIDNKKQWREY
jgi:hypothetical protein